MSFRLHSNNNNSAAKGHGNYMLINVLQIKRSGIKEQSAIIEKSQRVDVSANENNFHFL